MTDVGGHTVGGATPGPVVLGVIRKQAEQAMESRPISSVPLRASASAPALTSLYNVL